MFTKFLNQKSIFKYFAENNPTLFVPAISDDDLDIQQVLIFEEHGTHVIRTFHKESVAKEYVLHLKKEWEEQIYYDIDCIILKVKYDELIKMLQAAFRENDVKYRSMVCVVSIFSKNQKLYDLTELWRQLVN